MEENNWHRGSPRHTWLEHHFQGQKVKDQLAGGRGILWRSPALLFLRRLSTPLTTYVLGPMSYEATVGFSLAYMTLLTDGCIHFYVVGVVCRSVMGCMSG